MAEIASKLVKDKARNDPPSIEKAVGKSDDAMGKVDGKEQQFLSLCKMGLRMTHQRNGRILDTLKDTIRQVDELERMLEAEKQGEDDQGGIWNKHMC